MTQIRNRPCWVFWTVAVTITFIGAQLMLILLNNEEYGLRVRLTCITEENDAFVANSDVSCIAKVKIRRDENYDAAVLQVSGNLTDLSIRDYIIQRYSSPSDNGKIQKQRDRFIMNLEYAYTDVREMLNRPTRFPSVQERVKVYMSNWYVPPCDDSARIPYQYSTTSSGEVKLTMKEVALVQKKRHLITDDEIIQPDRQQRVIEINSHFDLSDVEEALDEVHFFDRQVFTECKHIYCKDTLSYLVPSFDRLLHNKTGAISHPNVPLLFQFGDMFETRGTIRYTKKNTNRIHIRYPRIPVFQKVRTSKSASGLKFETGDTKSTCYKKGQRRTTTKSNGFHFSFPYGALQMEPIIFKFKTFRHYGKIYTGAVVNADHTPWDRKKNVAIFRGALTGSYTNGMKTVEAMEFSVIERCQFLERCWFTYTHASSKLVDAKLTEPVVPAKAIPRIINASDDGTSKQVNLYGDRLSMEELLQYKALIMLEGNDISSGLKWALFSSSIVMMPEPTLTSWSMEEMLQPWVHYVPINVHRSSDGETTTDAEEKMQWILDNDDKAREIVKASTLWMADLILHPDEIDDEKFISDEIARRYLTHFVTTQELV